MTELTARELLVMLYQAAVDAVDGRFLVNQFLKQSIINAQNQQQGKDLSRFTHCVSIGKAAGAMLQGALDQTSSIKESLLICPAAKITRQLSKNKNITCIASSHPVPDEKSIGAGQSLLRFLSATTEKDNILFLISGGTSALVEVPVENTSLDQLQKINNYLLASGKNIHQMNAWRQQFSQIKGGGLLNWIKAPEITQLLISDVKGDKPEFIGSGLLIDHKTTPDQDVFLSSLLEIKNNAGKTGSNKTGSNETGIQVNTYIIGNIQIAMQAANEVAKNQNLNSYIHNEFLEGDVLDAAKNLYVILKDAEPGIHIWGGETTVCLPENPGVGGRNLTLALVFAQYIEDDASLQLLAAGTDGVDGNSNCAGGIASIYTSKKAKKMGFDLQQEIERANAGMVMMATDDLVVAENSNTNVMDIVIAYKLKD